MKLGAKAVPPAAATATATGTAVLLLVGLSACSSGGSAPGVTGMASPSAGAGWTLIQPSASVAPAASQAASDLAAYPSASEYPESSTQKVYSIAGVGAVGSVEYVDAYSVSYVCGAGIADDCDRFVGTPEYRIPLAAGVRFTLLGTDMRPNRPVGFAAFQQYAAGSDGKYDGNYDLFVVAFTGSHQAASLTAVYTP